MITFALVLAATMAASIPPPPAQAPDFPFTDAAGRPHTLAELRGQVVLLEFWAPWCIPCRKGFPLLDELQAKHQAAGLRVVAVTMETDDDAVADFIANHPARFLVGRDRTGRAGDLYDVTVMPTAVLLDREGKPIARFEGGTDEIHKRMTEAVDTALAGGALPALSETPHKQGPKGSVRAWERGYLADPIMNLDGDKLTRSMREHIHTSKEAATGDGGVSGGGCGCN